MYKASIELGRINSSLSIKFGLFITSEADAKSHTKLVNKFTYLGNEYLRVSPKPFITLDISSKLDKKEGWSTNRSVTLNKLALFQFIGALEKEIRFFKEKRNLFYYEKDKLKLNQEVGKDCVVISYTGSKAIRLQPCVVHDEEKDEIVYEGCVLCINTFDNFAYITYEEMLFLHHQLREINMDTLSMELVQLVTLYKHEGTDKIPTKKPAAIKDIVEEVNFNENKTFVKPKDESALPEGI